MPLPAAVTIAAFSLSLPDLPSLIGRPLPQARYSLSTCTCRFSLARLRRTSPLAVAHQGVTPSLFTLLLRKSDSRKFAQTGFSEVGQQRRADKLMVAGS